MDQGPNRPSQGHDSNNQKAYELLQEIFDSWSNRSFEDEQEYRSPDNRKEIRISRALLSEVKLLDVEEQDVLDRIEELEGVVDTIDATIPNNRGKMVRSIVFSLMIIATLFFLVNFNTYKYPVFEYNKEWFVTEKGGYLVWKAFVNDEDMPDVEQKLYLKKGTQLVPLAQIGNHWFQVETVDGLRGFVKNTILKGMRHVEAGENARVFNKIGDNREDSIAQGTKARVLERTKRKIRTHTIAYIKIELENGTVKWARENDFKDLIYNNVPEINQSYFYRTNLNVAHENMIGKPLPEIEKHYGPASSILKTKGQYRAYFNYLIVVDGKRDYKGVFVNLNDSAVAQGIEHNEHGKKRFCNNFPLVNTIRKLEPTKMFNYSFYADNEIHVQWWENFRGMNWITKVIAWIVKTVVMIFVLLLVFLLPWAIVSPINNSFAFNRYFSNNTVKLLCYLVYLTAAYLFYVFMILIMDQWLVPAIMTFLGLGIWSTMYIVNIEYDRCPNCNTMYSALDKGSTFKGQSNKVSWGTYDDYRGTSTHYRGNTKVITHNYDRYDEKTTTVSKRYLDHRTCARCGYQWSISRTETEEYTEYE